MLIQPGGREWVSTIKMMDSKLGGGSTFVPTAVTFKNPLPFLNRVLFLCRRQGSTKERCLIPCKPGGHGSTVRPPDAKKCGKDGVEGRGQGKRDRDVWLKYS